MSPHLLSLLLHVFYIVGPPATHFSVLHDGPTMIMGRLMFENHVEPVKYVFFICCVFCRSIDWISIEWISIDSLYINWLSIDRDTISIKISNVRISINWIFIDSIFIDYPLIKYLLIECSLIEYWLIIVRYCKHFCVYARENTNY